MLMSLGDVFTLLGLLIATVGLALDVVALVIAARKGKRPRHMRPRPKR
jgi:hypothetical protein